MFAETIRARPDIATGEGIDSSIPFVRVLLQFERIRSSLLEEMQAVEASGEVGMLNLVHGIIFAQGYSTWDDFLVSKRWNGNAVKHPARAAASG